MDKGDTWSEFQKGEGLQGPTSTLWGLHAWGVRGVDCRRAIGLGVGLAVVLHGS